MTVYDVGANCGQMTLFFSKMTGDKGRVLSFEPVPQNAAILRRIIDLNQLRNVKMMQGALASTRGTRSFCFSPMFHTMGALSQKLIGRDAEELLSVDCFTIDELVADGEPMPDFIKIDVEGGALEVIQGAVNTIRQKRPAIYLELHAANEAAPELQALRLLRDEFGYTISQMNGEEYSYLQPGWGVPHWCAPSQSQMGNEDLRSE